MVNRRNYYRILQVQPDAPVEIIRTSYRALMRDLKNHPDLGGDHRTASLINEAYAVLSNSRSRAEYDRKLFNDFCKQVLPEKGSRKRHVFSALHPFHRKSAMNGPAPRGSSTPGRNSHSAEESGRFQSNDARSVYRVKKEGTIHYYFSRDQRGGQATILDLSPEGVRFISDRDISRDTTLILQCPLFRAYAVVINANEIMMNEEFSYSIGARFLSVTFIRERGSFYSRAL